MPKLQKSGNRSILDSTDNFQIILSPDVPQIEPTDIIIESMWGKALMVQDKTWMNTRNRQMFGYEINVRVIQPAELFIYYLKENQLLKIQLQILLSLIGGINLKEKICLKMI